jgi:hypothetical protein
MTSPAEQRLMARFDAWLKHVGKSRDGILVVGGALYILGYIVWSINAYIQKLGLLPAFESQYFIAGIVPFLIIVVLYFLIRHNWTSKLRLLGWLKIGGTFGWWENFLKLLPSIFFVVSIFLSQTGLTKYLAGRTSLVLKILVLIAGLLVLLAIFSIDFGRDLEKLRTGSAGTNWKDKILLTVRSIIIVVAGAAVIIFYVLLVYSRLPQSLGGVRPRCAYLDVQSKGVSNNTLKAILPTSVSTAMNIPTVAVPNSTPVGTAGAESEIIRSDKLEVLFFGSDYVIVRVHQDVYEIKKDVIHALRSCD